ncbi:uncharacterized protein METZ01_LOCUS146851, partial [marine metagenome]
VNDRPQFQAEFHVSKEEPDAPEVGLPPGPVTTPPPSLGTRPL